MGKVIAAINMTLDGFCDHTAITPDSEIHDHYTALLRGADPFLYGRITYKLMEFWRDLAKNPSGEKSMDDFAVVMDKLPKIVFSHTLTQVDWKSARLATKNIEEEILNLKQKSALNIFIGSRSLIMQALKLNLIDELQLMVHPVVAGSGLPLFNDINEPINLTLVKTKTFSSGAVLFYYNPQKIGETY